MNDTALKTKTVLTHAQQRYAELDKIYWEKIKNFMDRLKYARQAVLDESGAGVFFQDADGIVYATADKKGQWVDFTPFEIQRTRRPGETKGSLSLTAARDAGFTVE